MNRPLTVSVTAALIAGGERNSAYRGPIALACGRALGGRECGTAGGYFFWVGPKGKWHWMELPTAAKAAEEAHDAGGEMEPFTFELKLWTGKVSSIHDPKRNRP